MEATIFSEFDEIPLWLQELLPPDQIIKKWNKGREIVENKITDKSILICNSQEESFVAQCERKGFQYGIISINDENLENYMGYATSKNCKFVIRGYFHPHVNYLLKSLGMNQKLLHLYPGMSNDFFKESVKNFAVPSAVFKAMFPVNPSATITFDSPLKILFPSM